MRDALTYEWYRIRSIRSTWWITAVAVVVGISLSTLFAWAIRTELTAHGVQAGDIEQIPPAVVTQLAASGEVPSVVCFLLAILGVFAWGHEYRHGMIRASLTALRSRTALWVAKFLVTAAWVAVVAVVTMLGSALAAQVFISQFAPVFTWEVLGVIARQTVYGVILAWLAMALTALTRSQAFAMVTIFLWPLLVEPLIHLFFVLVPGLRDHDAVLRFLPFDAGIRMVSVIPQGSGTFGDPLSPLGGAIVFGGLAAVLMAASLVLFHRRDA